MNIPFPVAHRRKVDVVIALDSIGVSGCPELKVAVERGYVELKNDDLPKLNVCG